MLGAGGGGRWPGPSPAAVLYINDDQVSSEVKFGLVLVWVCEKRVTIFFCRPSLAVVVLLVVFIGLVVKKVRSSVVALLMKQT